MSAQDRSARHRAVCGTKPGGASAYRLKETCLRKDRAIDHGLMRKRALSNHATRLQTLLDECNEISEKILARLGTRTLKDRNSAEDVKEITNCVIQLYAKNAYGTFKTCYSKAVEGYNKRTDLYNARTQSKSPKVLDSAKFIFAICANIQVFVPNAVLAAKAASSERVQK